MNLQLSVRKTTNQRAIKNFIRLVQTDLGYNEEGKRQFHEQASGILYALADALGYKSGDFDLRHNQGGVAVSGEITLHSDTLYVQLSQSSLGPQAGFMWRTCSGRKDYTGRTNQWASWDSLLDLPALAEKMKQAVEWAATPPDVKFIVR